MGKSNFLASSTHRLKSHGIPRRVRAHELEEEPDVEENNGSTIQERIIREIRNENSQLTTGLELCQRGVRGKNCPKARIINGINMCQTAESCNYGKERG